MGAVNKRLLTAKLRRKNWNNFIVVGYAPTNVADEQANNEVYVDLQYLFERISRVNFVLLLGEFNTVDICKNGLGTMNDIGLCYDSSGLPKI